MNNILVINLTRLGDVVQTTPMLQGIKRQYPNSTVSLLVNSQYRQMGEMIPCVDRLFTIDFKEISSYIYEGADGLAGAYRFLKKYFTVLRQNRFDRIINVTPHYIGMLSAFLSSGAKEYNGAVPEWTKYFTVITRNWKSLPYHVVDLYHRVACNNQKNILPEISAPPECIDSTMRNLHAQGITHNDRIVGIHGGGSTPEKRWPDEYYVELCERILDTTSDKIVFVGAGMETGVLDNLGRKFPGRFVNMLGKTDLPALTVLLDAVSVFITNDSGPMHIAAALGTKIISIHTGKEACTSTGPYGVGHIAFEPALDCHPCEHPESCSTKSCRYAVTPAHVFSALSALLRVHTTEEHDGMQGNAANVYKSGFDAAGCMDFRPIVETELTGQIFARYIARSMWDIALSSDRSKKTDIENMLDSASERVAGYVCRHYACGVPDTIRNKHEKTKECTGYIITTADEAMRITREIARLGSDPLRNAAGLKELTVMLEEIDCEIISRGAMLPRYYASLTDMLMYDKEILNVDTIPAMAYESEQMYLRLSDRAALLRALEKRVLASIDNTTISQGGVK